jgi:hypothetical protein
LVGIIKTGNNDDISAFLTVGYISHTGKIESTRSIVDMWENLRSSISIKNNLDYISGLLVTGRIMDVKKEILNKKFVTTISELVSSFSTELEKRLDLSEIKDSHFTTALLTSAYISRTDEIETINAIIDRWEEINEKVKINDDIDIIAAILTAGRIMEEKYKINNINQILDVFNYLNDILRKMIGDREVSQKDIGAAFLTNANVEISPDVEKIQNIIDIWNDIQNDLIINDDLDYTVTLLAYGRIRDINVQFFVSDSIISEIKSSIRTYIDSKM